MLKDSAQVALIDASFNPPPALSARGTNVPTVHAV